MKKKISYMITTLCLFIAVSTTIIIQWLYNSFGNLTINEIVFQLKVPMQGTSTQMVWDFLKQCPLKIIIITVILAFVLIYPTKKTSKSVLISTIASVIILIISTTRIFAITDVAGYITSQINTSEFIEQEYVNPENVEIKFPDQKRNLIYIFLESMETTYYLKEDGGLAEQDLIPEISKLAKQHLNFSETNQLGD